jgi:hypothetical protein
MDLNDLAPLEPAPPLKIVRLSRRNEEVEVPVFEGGEALPESAGYDVGHPISPEEQAALDLADKEWDTNQIALLDTEMQQAKRAAYELAEEAAAKAAYEAHLEDSFHSRECPLPACETVIRVKKDGDQGDVLGIGMSMAAASKLEGFLIEHLQSHNLGEWMAALQEAQEEAKKARITAYGPAHVAVAAQEGIIPGAKHRDPAKQAAVDALDARLGRSRPPSTPQEAADRDELLRARRAARRAVQPSPFDLTPAWSQNLGDGVVGIKR